MRTNRWMEEGWLPHTTRAELATETADINAIMPMPDMCRNIILSKSFHLQGRILQNIWFIVIIKIFQAFLLIVHYIGIVGNIYIHIWFYYIVRLVFYVHKQKHLGLIYIQIYQQSVNTKSWLKLILNSFIYFKLWSREIFKIDCCFICARSFISRSLLILYFFLFVTSSSSSVFVCCECCACAVPCVYCE